MDLRELRVNYHRFNQVVTPVAAAKADVVLLFQDMNTFLSTWEAAIDLVNVYCPSLSIRYTASDLFSAGKASNIP